VIGIDRERKTPLIFYNGEWGRLRRKGIKFKASTEILLLIA